MSRDEIGRAANSVMSAKRGYSAAVSGSIMAISSVDCQWMLVWSVRFLFEICVMIDSTGTRLSSQVFLTKVSSFPVCPKSRQRLSSTGSIVPVNILLESRLCVSIIPFEFS